MFGLVVLLCALSAASLLLTFLTLVCVSRVVLSQRDSFDALIDGHNHVARRVADLGEQLESAMDCLLILDATAANSSPEVNAVE